MRSTPLLFFLSLPLALHHLRLWNEAIRCQKKLLSFYSNLVEPSDRLNNIPLFFFHIISVIRFLCYYSWTFRLDSVPHNVVLFRFVFSFQAAFESKYIEFLVACCHTSYFLLRFDRIYGSTAMFFSSLSSFNIFVHWHRCDHVSLCLSVQTLHIYDISSVTYVFCPYLCVFCFEFLFFFLLVIIWCML